jgi:hypothetical protein
VVVDPITIEQLVKLRAKLVFRPLGVQNYHGAISADNTMELDPRSHSPLARTILHELVHAARPLWSETRVRREERKLWAAATWQEKAELFKLAGKATIWAGEGAIPDEPKGAEIDAAV